MQRAAAVAGGLGRQVHLLQWDVARLAFDTPAILARYPEVGGVTHAAIRVAAGRWAREAVRRWHESRPGREHVLVGEVPIVGERLASLARRSADGIEPLLASEATLFLVPVPSRAVRRAIEAARSSEMADPRHDRDRTSAPPDLVRWHWDDLVGAARALRIPGAVAARGYDPDIYAAVYRRLLRHRHSSVLPIEAILPVVGSVHSVPAVTELVPTIPDVTEAIRWVEQRPTQEIERLAVEWYRL